jgi:hypothetical protein
MTLLEQEDAFLQAVRAARGWVGMGKEEFTKLLFGSGSESTGDRLERGRIQKRTGSVDARRQLAQTIIEKTGCPPGLFGLSELEPGEADQLREEMQAMKVELLAEIEKVRRAQASALASSEPRAGD